jgi:UDP-glucose 4-epimerase
VIGAVLGRRAPLTVFGDDFGTPDGTFLGDDVHVTDPAAAHVAAVDATIAPGRL